MKIVLLWVIIAFLLGFALFGFFKALELTASNLILNNSLSALKGQFSTTEIALKASREALSDSYLKNAELEGSLAGMELKLTRQSKEIKAHLGRISEMSEKLQEIARDNAYLSGRNSDVTNQLIREKLHGEEMRRKLSSVVELKKAIKELRAEIRKSKKSAPKFSSPATSKWTREKVAESSDKKEVTKGLLEGNMGYVIKDGRSTFDAFVDIRVVPAEN